MVKLPLEPNNLEFDFFSQLHRILMCHCYLWNECTRRKSLLGRYFATHLQPKVDGMHNPPQEFMLWCTGYSFLHMKRQLSPPAPMFSWWPSKSFLLCQFCHSSLNRDISDLGVWCTLFKAGEGTAAAGWDFGNHCYRSSSSKQWEIYYWFPWE